MHKHERREQSTHDSYFNPPLKCTKQKAEANYKKKTEETTLLLKMLALCGASNLKKPSFCFFSSPLFLLFSSQDKLGKRKTYYDQASFTISDQL